MPSNYSESYEEQTISEKSINKVPDIPKDNAIHTTTQRTIPNIEANRSQDGRILPGTVLNPTGKRGQRDTVMGKLRDIMDTRGTLKQVAANLEHILARDIAAIEDDAKRDKAIAQYLDAIRISLPYTDGRPESHQYVHRDTTQLYSVLQIALSTTDMPSDIRARIIASIERQLGRGKQAAIDATPSNKAIEGEKAKEDP